MPVMAVCPSCGKSYQAPDSMAGKSVRCKQCQTVFKIESPETFEDDIGGSTVDFDQLQRSFEGEDAEGTAAGTAAGTRAGGPSIDKDGRVSIRRGADVSAMDVQGDGYGGGKRTNLRFRYPMARQVDVGLPFVIVALALIVPLWLSLTTGSKPGEYPTSGVGLSRYAVLLLTFLVCVVPLVHIAATKASDALHFHLPRNPMWRSFACACATLLLASTLFILAGGSTGGAIAGIVVGACATVAAGLLLYRAIPHEMGMLSAYLGVAAVVGAGVAAAVIGGISFTAASIAGSQENLTLDQNPIAIGARWVDKKTEVAGTVKPKANAATPPKPTAPTPAPSNPTPAPTPAAPQPMPIALDQLIADGDARKFVKSADQLPVPAGFRTVVTTLVPSQTVGVVRDVGGGVIELWNTTNWTLPAGATGRNFDFNQAPLFVNATGDRVVRLVTSPYLRIEPITLTSGGAPMQPVTVGTDAKRSIAGFVDEKTLLVRAESNRELTFEQYDLSAPTPAVKPEARPIGTMEPIQQVSKPMSIEMLNSKSICFLAGNELVAAGRDITRNNQTCIGLYSLDHLGEPLKVCDVPWSNEPFAPLGMAATPAGQVALLMDTNGEAWLSVWQLKDETVNGETKEAASTWLVERKIGSINSLREGAYWPSREDALIWLDRDTLLLYGRHVIDAKTTTILGTVRIPNAVSLIRIGDGEVVYTVEGSGLRSLTRVKFDLAHIASLRQPAAAAN